MWCGRWFFLLFLRVPSGAPLVPAVRLLLLQDAAALAAHHALYWWEEHTARGKRHVNSRVREGHRILETDR